MFFSDVSKHVDDVSGLEVATLAFPLPILVDPLLDDVFHEQFFVLLSDLVSTLGVVSKVFQNNLPF